MNEAAQSVRTVSSALLATTGIQALVTMASLTVSVYAAHAARDMGIDPEYIGVYASLTYIGAMLGSLFAGSFILRFGPIRFSQGAMFVCAIGLLFCIGAHWWWFLLSALVLGFGYGPTTPASSYLLSQHTPRRFLSLVFSIKQTGVPLGGVLAGLLVPLLLRYFEWRIVTVIVAACVLLGAVGLQTWRQQFDIERQPVTPPLSGNWLRPLRLIFSRPQLRVLAIGSFFFSATQQCYIYFVVTFLEIEVAWSTQQAGLALSCVGLAAIMARIVWGRVADLSGQSRRVLGVIALGMALSTILTAGFDEHWQAWQIYLVCFAFGTTGAAWNGVYLAEISRQVASDEVGYATGGGLFVTFAGVVVAPPLFGFLAHLSGSFYLGYLFFGTASAVVGACFLLPSRLRS